MTKNAALITGGAKRLGSELASKLASLGYDIAINYKNSKEDAENLAQQISKKFSVKVKIYQADLSDCNSAKRLINKVFTDFSHLNLLINNASIFNKSKFLEADDKELYDNLNIHFLTPLILSKEFALKTANKGHIINMVDKNIVRFDTNYFYYLLSKKFLGQLTQMLALELAPNIRVNAIAPGFILNSINCLDNESETLQLMKKIPLKQKGDVKNIIKTLEFLLKNDFVTGQILFIDGGASLNHAG